MTLAELQAATYEDTGYQAAPATPVVTRVTRYLNEGLLAILAEPDLRGLLDANVPVTFISSATVPRYELPAAVAVILAITDRTNDRKIEPMPLSEYRRRDPDPADTSGSPTHYVPLGLTPGTPTGRVLAFYLYPTPSAAVTYYVDYRRDLTKLTASTDEPLLPLDFHPMLVKYAAFREWELKDDSRAVLARQQYEKWLSRLKYRLHDLGLPVMTVAGRTVGRSRLGGNFPADSLSEG